MNRLFVIGAPEPLGTFVLLHCEEQYIIYLIPSTYVYLWCLSLLTLYSYLLKLYIWVWLFPFMWGLFENCQKQIHSRGWSGAPESFYCYNNCHFRKITRRSNNPKSKLLKSRFNFRKNGKDTFKNHEGIQITKGQLISKCLFGVFNSPKKWTKTIQLEVR